MTTPQRYIVKISNLTGANGIADYKGLNIDLNVAGSQVYPNDENVAYLFNTGAIPEHADIEIITEEEYLLAKQAHESKPRPATVESRVQQLEGIVMMAVMEGKL